MKSFEEIKTAKLLENDLFIFEYNSIYNVTYFNERKNIEIKFEIFKILVKQIISKIKDILNSNSNDYENKLKLERNPSNISENDYQELFKIIISYFLDINPDCLFYNDIILFFYKLFINYEIFQTLLLTSYPNFISKIMKIAFGIEKCINVIEIKDKFKYEDYDDDDNRETVRGRGRGRIK